MYEKLFEYGQIGDLQIKNRIIMAPMETNMASETGGVTERLIKYHEERARGGVGLIIVEFTCVDYPEGKAAAPQLSIHDDKLITGHNNLVEAVHRHGAKIALQIVHGGRQTTKRRTEGFQPVAPSPIPCGLMREQPRELSLEEINALVEKFAMAAQRAQMAGYDAVEIHGAHGYLVAQFMSAYTNKRYDEYGGTFERRMTFPLKIIKKIKERTGDSYPIIFRFSANEFVEGGRNLEESIRVAQVLEKVGISALHVSTGIHESKETNVEPITFPQGWRVPYAEAIRKEVKIPIITVGVIREPEFAENILVQEKADFVALGRALLADPQWPEKVRLGKDKEIRKCTSCCNCIGRFDRNLGVRCQVNPLVGRENDLRISPNTSKVKKVVVIGGGPGGLETARVAASRGHKVTLMEKDVNLGGKITLAARIPGKDKLKWIIDYYSWQMEKLCVEISYGVEADKKMVLEQNPDVVVLAVGTKPKPLSFSVEDDKKIITAEDVLSQKKVIKGKSVIVLGGRATGCETAIYLAKNENQVQIISRSPVAQLAKEQVSTYRNEILKQISELGIGVIDRHEVEAVLSNGISIINNRLLKNFIACDVVVLARGYVAQTLLYEQLRKEVLEIYQVGDCNQPRSITEAIYEGFLVGSQI